MDATYNALAAQPTQPAPVDNINPDFDGVVDNLYDQGCEQLPATPQHQPAPHPDEALPPNEEEAEPPRNEYLDPFVGLERPEPVPNGLPELHPEPLFDFAEVHHLRPGLIPGLSHRQREGLTRTLIFQRQNRVDRYRVIDAAEDELDALRYEARLLRVLADRDEQLRDERLQEIAREFDQRWRDALNKERQRHL